jgi:hypothetical protein
MSPTHEAVADQADVQRFLLRHEITNHFRWLQDSTVPCRDRPAAQTDKIAPKWSARRAIPFIIPAIRARRGR